MDKISRQSSTYITVWLTTLLLIAITLLTSEIKYGYCAIAFAILTHSESVELRYRENTELKSDEGKP